MVVGIREISKRGKRRDHTIRNYSIRPEAKRARERDKRKSPRNLLI